MKKEEAERLTERVRVLEEDLRGLCNHIMKMRRQAEKSGNWVSMGCDPYQPLTDEAQQGPLVTQLYGMVDEARKKIRNK